VYCKKIELDLSLPKIRCANFNTNGMSTTLHLLQRLLLHPVITVGKILNDWSTFFLWAKFLNLVKTSGYGDFLSPYFGKKFRKIARFLSCVVVGSQQYKRMLRFLRSHNSFVAKFG
jgi:hypothetical protein